MKTPVIFVALLMATAGLGIGQTADGTSRESPQQRLRAMGAIEAPGSVPLFYVASAKERALRLQKSLEAAHEWYEQQLGIKVPILFAVADSAMWGKIQDLYCWMCFPPRPGPKLVAIRDQAQANAAPDADPAHAKGGILNNEHVLFHDDGHILADAENIQFGNKSANEAVASMFMVMYILAERPDMQWVLNSSRTMPAPPNLRYTTLADLDYLDGTWALSAQNIYWFLRQLVAALVPLSKNRDIRSVVAKLQQAFAPPGRQELPAEINARFERVWPGFARSAGPLIGPSTIRRTTGSTCQNSEARNEPAYVVIQNEGANPITVEDSDHRKSVIAEHSWRTFAVKVGEAIRLPDGTCLVGRDEPTLTIIETK